MHIVLSVITALAGLIWAISSLQKSGFDINSLNPFLWHRRNSWRNIHDAKPIINYLNRLMLLPYFFWGLQNVKVKLAQNKKI